MKTSNEKPRSPGRRFGILPIFSLRGPRPPRPITPGTSARPTPLGVGSILMVVLILLAAFNTGTNLLYIMGGTLLSLLTLSLVYGRLNVAGLSASIHAPAEEFQDRDSSITFELTNNAERLARYGVIVGTKSYPNPPNPSHSRVSFAHLQSPAARTLFTLIEPRKSQDRPAPFRFTRRGVTQFQSVELISFFPLGLIEYRRRIPCDAETLVYPKLLPIRPRFGGLARGPGEQELAVKGHGSELHTIRDYVPGDPARDIHWKLSAKGTGIKVREYESEATAEIQLVLDFPIPSSSASSSVSSAPTPEESAEFEIALSVAASLARHYIQEDIPVGLWTAGGEVPFGNGEKHARRIYRALANLEIESLDPRAIQPEPTPTRWQIQIVAGPSPLASPTTASIQRVHARTVYEEAMETVEAKARAGGEEGR